MERSVLQGLAVFRWGAWLWMTAVLAVSRQDLARPWLALGLAGLALAVTAGDTALLRTDHPVLVRPVPVLCELAVGAALVLCDGWAYAPGHAFSTSQSLGSVWPLAGILSAGVALGRRPAALAGILIGLARTGAVLANGAAVNAGGRALSLVNTAVFYALGGFAAGYLAHLLREAEATISVAKAREEVARTLHDGVLQTLAVVERRTTDPALAALARDQERELREYLFGTGQAIFGGGDLGASLRAAARRWERHHGGRVDVIMAEDLPSLPEPLCEALVGAAGEALTNAAKHGQATQVTIYVEPGDADGVFCSIKDNGSGFDPSDITEGIGLSRSIRGRIGEAGGSVEIRSEPGAGAEILLWLP